MLERAPSPLPELPPYDHRPRPYTGPDFETVRDLRQRLDYLARHTRCLEGAAPFAQVRTGGRPGAVDFRRSRRCDGRALDRLFHSRIEQCAGSHGPGAHFSRGHAGKPCSDDSFLRRIPDIA